MLIVASILAAIIMFVGWLLLCTPSSWKIRRAVARALVGNVAVNTDGDGDVTYVYYELDPDMDSDIWKRRKHSTSAALRAANAKLKEQVDLLTRDKAQMVYQYDIMYCKMVMYKQEATAAQEHAKA
jgi:hypothetical protein